MPHPHHLPPLPPLLPSGVADSMLAGMLVSAPFWADLLGSINKFLTTITLALGVVLALIRLRAIIAEQKRKATPRQTGNGPDGPPQT